MKFKQPRQKYKQENVTHIIERELDRIEMPPEPLSPSQMKQLKTVVSHIETRGIPKNLVWTKVSDEIGYGIFLHPKAEPLKKGTLIGPYSGLVILEVEEDSEDSAYAFSMVDNLRLRKAEQTRLDTKNKFAPNRNYALNLDANSEGNFTRYINHCEKPNVEAVILSVHANRLGLEPSPIEVFYFVKKQIKPGEQLLVCYEDEAETYWDAYGSKPVPITPQTYQLNDNLEVVKH